MSKELIKELIELKKQAEEINFIHSNRNAIIEDKDLFEKSARLREISKRQKEIAEKLSKELNISATELILHPESFL